MSVTAVVSPNPVVRPAAGGVTANIYIGGLTPGTRYNIRVDATTIATARATREGSLAVGITVGSASKFGGHAVDVRDSANKATLAAGMFTVAAAPPPPVDPPPPPPAGPKVITGPAVTIAGGIPAVSWGLDQPCTGHVEYGPTAAYGSATAPETSFAYTAHVQPVPGLLAGTYHFRVTGKNAAGQGYASADGTFTTSPVVTPPPPPPAPPPPPTGLVFPTPRKLIAVAVSNDPKPAMGQLITDTYCGTRIRRISPDGHQNQYAKHQAWSKDGSLIYMQFGNLYDVASNTFLGNMATGGEFPIWSNIEPSSLYAVDGNSQRFMRWTRATGWRVYRDFAGQGYTYLTVGNYEGTFSRDDKLVFIGRKGSTPWLMVYDIPNNRIVAEVQWSEPNGAAISQSGKYVMANMNGTGSGHDHGGWLLRDDLTVVRQMVSGGYVGQPIGHQDFGWDQAGNEVLVYVEGGGGGAAAQRLDGQGGEYFIARGIFGVGHVSCANYDRPGWAYLSSNSFYPGAYGVNQAVAVKVAPNAEPPDGEVFACLHDINPATSQGYDTSAHVSASRDGSKVIWGSVWSNTSSGPMSAYIAGVTV